MSGHDTFGPVYTPQEIEEMHSGIGRRLRGVVKIAEGLDVDDPDQLADRAWLLGTVEDVTAWFDMQDAHFRREASNQDDAPASRQDPS